MTKILQCKDFSWDEYPVDAKARAVLGGYWIKVKNGWKWQDGSTFPTPGGNACGRCIEFPTRERKCIGKANLGNSPSR